MRRIATSTAVDIGSGRLGFTNGVPNVTPATRLADYWFNSLQEEVARCVELHGVALDTGNNEQLAAIVLDKGSQSGTNAWSGTNTWTGPSAFDTIPVFHSAVRYFSDSVITESGGPYFSISARGVYQFGFQFTSQLFSGMLDQFLWISSQTMACITLHWFCRPTDELLTARMSSGKYVYHCYRSSSTVSWNVSAAHEVYEYGTGGDNPNLLSFALIPGTNANVNDFGLSATDPGDAMTYRITVFVTALVGGGS